MKFDFIIGNPPYHCDIKDTSKESLYDKFMDEAYKLSNHVELVTPARFLFKAGKTPNNWDEKMLADEHFKILYYEYNSASFFPNTDIEGGIVISYRDSERTFVPIKTFFINQLSKTITSKVLLINNKTESTDTIKWETRNLSELIYSSDSYKFTQKLHDENPEIWCMLSKDHKYALVSNIFEKLSGIVFFENMPDKNSNYITTIGIFNNHRVYRYIKREYIHEHDNLHKWKVAVPKSNGSNMVGTGKASVVIGMPVILKPDVSHTQTFISIGAFDTEYEATSLNKYICTKFVRMLISVLKPTQDNKKDVWKFVPLLDFTINSDIDWSVSISEIDQQLYKKYSLTEEEINFIETNVKEMK